MLMFKTKVFLCSLLGEGIYTLVQRLSFAPRHRLARLVARSTNKPSAMDHLKDLCYFMMQYQVAIFRSFLVFTKENFIQ